MNKIIEIIKNIKEEDYYSKVNLHIHTNISDGKLSPQDVIIKAQDTGMKLISITDHNTCEAYNYIEKTNDLDVIYGVEFDCWHKTTLLHILGYGLDIKNEKLNKLCSNTNLGKRADFIRFFNKRKAKEVIQTIKEADGIAVLAHPACCLNINLSKMIAELKNYGLDGIEVYYPYSGYKSLIKLRSIQKMKEIAIKYNLLITGGTDCHGFDLNKR